MVSDHALDSTRYAPHTELGRLARAEALRADLRTRVWKRRQGPSRPQLSPHVSVHPLRPPLPPPPPAA